MTAEWVLRPSAFVRECLRATPDAWQDDVLEAVAQGRQRIALKASKGPGKSTVLAWLAWWFLATRLDPKVVATSVSEANLQDGLWTELAKWQQRSPELKRAFVWGKERITARQHPETWWCAARTWAKTADPSQQSNTLAGVHADHVLFLVDEAGGIPDAVVATAEAGLANAGIEQREAILVIAGNPTHLSGPLYRACTRERHLWWIREVSGDPDDPKRASRVNVQWAREQIEKYGRDDPWVLINVFGRFPPAQSNALVGVEEATAAAKRELARRQYESEVKILGVDVARYGDDRSVLFPRQGLAAMKPRVFRHQDTMQLSSQVGWLTDKWQPDAIFVDQATFGAGVVDRVKELGYPVIGVDFGGKPGDSKYRNMRAQMWHRMAEWIRSGGAIPNMPELIAELTTPIYDFDDHGKLRVEKKEEVKKRCHVSPDLADALCFVAGTLVLTPHGQRPIESLRVGDEVVTPWAVRKVLGLWESETDRLTTARFSNGASLAGKGSHPVFTWDAGWVRLDALSLTNEVETDSAWSRLKWLAASLWSTGGRSSGFSRTVDTFSPAGRLTLSGCFTDGSGRMPTAPFLKALTCITSMRTGGTTSSQISRLWSAASTLVGTCANGMRLLKVAQSHSPVWRLVATPLGHGIEAQTGSPGTPNMGASRGAEGSGLSRNAGAAGRIASLGSSAEPSTAAGRARRESCSGPTSTILGRALSAARSFWRTATGRPRIAPVSVRIETVAPVKTYNLTLDADNAYYANGVLVRNCLTFAAPVAHRSLRALQDRGKGVKFDYDPLGARPSVRRD